ncbi:MAG: hypothetical protein AAF602_04785 [Myxococcota bacterium]
MVWMAMLNVVVAAAPGEATLDTPIEQAFASCAPYATHAPPALDARDLRRLREGHVVQALERGKDKAPSAAVGIVLADASVTEAWLACQGPHAEPGENPEFLVRELPRHQAIWYGYVALPWPLKDRQYVVKSRANISMAHATGNRCWEHAWQEFPQALEDVRPMVAKAPIEVDAQPLF